MIVAEKEALWNAIQKRRGLAAHGYGEVAALAFGDGVFA
jgi:hypothetical protein